MTDRIPPDAFEFYVALGPARSHRAVAQHFSVSKRTITKVAVREKWAERLEAIESDARENSDKRLAESMEEMRVRHVKTVRAIHSRALTALQQFPLTSGMDAIRAAELAIKLERLVVGEPTERTALTIEEITRREINELLVTVDGDVGESDEQEGDDDEW
jgi:hypothetical protein